MQGVVRTHVPAKSTIVVPAAQTLAQQQAAAAAATPGVSVGPILIIGALGIAGYLAYRHFKKH